MRKRLAPPIFGLNPTEGHVLETVSHPGESSDGRVWSPDFSPSGAIAIEFRTALRPDSKRFCCAGGVDLCVVRAIDWSVLMQAGLSIRV